ncbi:MAG: adenosylcobinamide-GDP ribazoletransferase [Rhodospirillaceae bacterium]
MIRRLAADLHLAVVFLTRLPMPRLPVDVPPLARAMWAFPLVGAFVGLLAATVLSAALSGGLSPAVAALLAVGAGLWLTGGLHEDGLADVADGFGGGATRQRKLEILRDSRIGSYGVLALVIALGLKVAALSALPAVDAAAALVAAAAQGRAVLPLAMLLAPPARADGLGAGAGEASAGVTAAAGAVAVGLGVWLLPWADVLLAVGAAGLACAVVVMLARRHIGGYTGDVLGAAALTAEVAVLVVLSR